MTYNNINVAPHFQIRNYIFDELNFIHCNFFLQAQIEQKLFIVIRTLVTQLYFFSAYTETTVKQTVSYINQPVFLIKIK